MHGIALATRGYVLAGIRRIVEQVPLPPNKAQSLLVKSLELPLPPSVTSALGIFQSDVIIRSALIAAIADLRANDWLLDYVFASLPRDSLTMSEYGEQEVEQAKKWFLSTDIPVLMNTRADDANVPCITIALLESTEAETTLSDVHFQPSETKDDEWPSIVGPFTPTSYNAGTGILKLPEDVAAQLIVSTGQIVVDRVGREHEITEVLDSRTVVLKEGTVADFTGAVIKGQRPAFVTSLESVAMKETYSIGCHVQNEPVQLTYLHSIVTFILLRYKQALLEARGFERSQLSSSDFRKEEAFHPENVYSRYLTITGFVRQYWPKSVDKTVQGLELTTYAADGNTRILIDENKDSIG